MTFPTYDELTQRLQALCADHPHLLTLESIGESYEGRDVWLVTATNRETGEAADKPALWIDGNIHSVELAASVACLHFLEHLVRRYGDDAQTTRCLDTRAFYVCPRVNPDGAELALAPSPRFTRSSVRPHPHDEEAVEGLDIHDIDGDGRILSMRIEDPNGPWKVSDRDARLLVRRDPTEEGGRYYRLAMEGTILNPDGVHVPPTVCREGLDLNRNFPAEWAQEDTERGAGPYPTSEPEVRAIVDFIARHKNLTGAISFHTFSGLLLRPYSYHPDEEFPVEDLRVYEKLGESGARLTGYPAVSCYHEFRYHPKEITHGAFDDWTYDHLGLFSWTIEIWSPQRQAGIESYAYIDWYREHEIEDDLKMLKWSDDVLGGEGYIEWYPFDHPQLGPVELGGWNKIHAITNPPPAFLQSEVERFPEWLVWLLLVSPKLELLEASATRLSRDADQWKVQLVVQNTGWLPSYVSKKALAKKLTRGVVCEISLPDGAELIAGRRRALVGELEGRAYKLCVPWAWSHDATNDRAMVEWVVRAKPGDVLTLHAAHDRAGRLSTTITL